MRARTHPRLPAPFVFGAIVVHAECCTDHDTKRLGAQCHCGCEIVSANDPDGRVRLPPRPCTTR